MGNKHLTDDELRQRILDAAAELGREGSFSLENLRWHVTGAGWTNRVRPMVDQLIAEGEILIRQPAGRRRVVS